MKDIKTSCEVHVELADIEKITDKDYLWLFECRETVAYPFMIWFDEDEENWFDWNDNEEWIARWKELREFFLDQGFCSGQIIWINIEE